MELWAWGANSYGQLGIGTRCEQIDTPIKIPIPSGCDIGSATLQIAGGGGHTLLADASKERLFAVGWNNKGQLGLSDNEDVESFKEVNLGLLEGNGRKLVKKVACGWDFSFVLFSDGTVFGCGSNAFGQLGLNEASKQYSTLIQITSLKDVEIVDVSCGMRHALFLDGKGNVYSTGCNKKGQLGLGESVKRLYIPTLISGISSVVSVHCGQHFSAVVITSKTGCKMFTFGDNKYNQVSNSSVNTVYTPEVRFTNESSENERILTTATCGWTHAIIMLRNGTKNELMSWGRNTYGQLGSISARNTEGFVLVELNDPLKISTGYEHTLVVTEKGKLHAWGWNEHSNCGLGGSRENIIYPKLVSVESEKLAVNCYAGSAHSFALLQSK